MSDIPTTTPPPAGDARKPEGWDAELFGPPPWTYGQPARSTVAERVKQFRDAVSDAFDDAVESIGPRWYQLQGRVRRAAHERADLASRVGRHPADIPSRHGNTPLRRVAVAAFAPARRTRIVLSVIGLLAGLLLLPAVAAWRPYVQLQHALGRNLPAWAIAGGHPHGTGQRVVHWLATSSGPAVLVALVVVVWAAARVTAIADAAAHGYTAPINRLSLAAAIVGLAAAAWHPASWVGHRVAGASAGELAPVVLALALGAAAVAFNAATNWQARTVRRLNYYTARADMAEKREAAVAQPPLASNQSFTGGGH